MFFGETDVQKQYFGNDVCFGFFAISVCAAEIVLIPTADTFVRDGGNVDDNFGEANRIELKFEGDREGMTRVGFLKFDISSIAAVEKANLRLYIEFSDQLDVRTLAFSDVTGEEWSEGELTWAAAPLGEAELIAEIDVVSQLAKWYEVDVTEWLKAYVAKGAQEISIRINNKADHWGGAVFVTSKEGDEENHPQLVVVN